MTGFDETVPPTDGPADDENAATIDPAHDSVEPALEDEPDPDEVRGQYGPTADYGSDET